MSDEIGFTDPQQLLDLSQMHQRHAQALAEQAGRWTAGQAQASATPGFGGDGFDEMHAFLGFYAQILQRHSDHHARLSMAVATCWANLTDAGQSAQAALESNAPR
jgi:hypothetical protein